MDDVFLSSYLGPDGYGDDCTNPTPINNNTTYNAKIEVPGGWDYFTIHLNAGGRMTIYTQGGTDTYGYLYDDLCGIMEENDDNGSGNNFRIRRYVNAGDYIIGVRHYDQGAGTGSYRIRIDLDQGADSSPNVSEPTPPQTITLNPTIKNAHYFVAAMVDSDGDGQPDLDATGNPVADPNKIYLVHMDNPAQINYYRVTENNGVMVSMNWLDPADAAHAAEIATITPPTRKRFSYADAANPTDAELWESERQNFVNWYSFYRRRELTAKAAVGEVIDSLKGVAVGFYSINRRLLQSVLKVRVTEEDAQGNDLYIDNTTGLLHDLYGLDSSGYTPLRRALNDVGMYFDADDGNSGRLGSAPWYTDTSGECQQSFAILMTDGFYNGPNPGVDNNAGDGTETGHTDPAGDEMYADSISQTLGDVAMKYYKNDLEDNLTNRVPINFIDEANHQHMVTYTVSFGLTGTLNPEDFDLYNSNPVLRDYPAWPDPRIYDRNNPEKIDDMWHAAVNGRGMFLTASKPDELVSALQEVMLNLTSRIGSGASLTVNGEELHDGSIVYQAKYSTDGWVGDIQAFRIDQISGEVITGDGNAIWSASQMLGEGSDWNIINWDTDREIASYDPATDTGVKFRWNPASGNGITAAQQALLNDNPLTVAVDSDGLGEDRLEYLRGNNALEKTNAGPFRPRYTKLGDIVHSSPLYKGYDSNNDDVIDYGVLFAGSNDGMLHAFDADTGAELFAYVPNLVFDYLNMLPLAEPNFKHRFYVDLTPFVKDTGDKTVAGNHGRLLVGGLGKGGHGYYCLDVTTPLLNDESDLSWVKWEYPKQGSTAAEKDNMGYSYSKAFIVKSDAAGHRWVVIFGNGYGSTSETAALYILDAGSGDLVRMLDTGTAGSGNGLSTPTPVDVDGDNTVDYVYVGDLNGNLWKFDLTDPNPANWSSAFWDDTDLDGVFDVGETPQPLFRAIGREREPDGSYVSNVTWDQPITTRPQIINYCGGGYLVLFATGQYLSKMDTDNTDYQTVYGLWDYGQYPDDYLGDFKRGAVQQLSNQGTAIAGPTLVEQTVDFWGANPFNAGQNLRVLSDNEPDYSTYILTGKPKVHAGWYFDLPLTGERVVRDITVRDNKLVFISSLPKEDPCAAGGDSIVHEVNACTGARLATPQFDINNDGKIDKNDMIALTDASGNPILDSDGNPIMVAPTGMMFGTMMYPPIFLKTGESEMKHFSTSAGNVATMKEKGEQTGMYFWRQIER
jgi:type IV pilus assembly protein PilY1